MQITNFLGFYDIFGGNSWEIGVGEIYSIPITLSKSQAEVVFLSYSTATNIISFWACQAKGMDIYIGYGRLAS